MTRDVSDTSRTPELDIERLTAWMDDQGLPGAGSPVEHRFISGGAQNEIYEIRRDGLHTALRIPPASAPDRRDEGIWREWRIIRALSDTDVPHTPAVAACRDTDVLGRAFYLMGFVDGWSPMGMEVDDNGNKVWPSEYGDLDARKQLAHELVEGIALLSNVDWWAQGLGDLGRPDGFHDRQVDRWTAFLDRVKGRDLPGFDEAAAWLRAHRPLDFVPGLMHGDYQFANVMYDHGTPARLAAIVDWEMGTIGDPKLDLGWVTNSWPADPMNLEPSATSYVDMYGMPTKDELLAHYSQVSGRQVDDIDYYEILAKWKLAVVLEAGYQRAGENDEALQAFGPFVLALMEQAADLAESSDYQG